MKNCIFIFLFTFLNTLSISAQSQWSVMGDSLVSYTDGDHSWITLDNNGVPYIVYSDGFYLGATVKKFDGSQWITVGTEAFSEWNHNNTMAFDNMNTPYIAFYYTPNSTTALISVMKFDGTNWVYVGAKGFVAGVYPSLAIDKNGTPYIAFDHNGASVMKFDGTNWVYVGANGFSAGNALYTSLALDTNGNPYVAYWDMSDIQNQPPYKTAVMKFDGNNWVNVGTPGFSGWIAGSSQAIALDSKNIPYVVCSLAGQTAVMKFDGSNWITVGQSGISQGAAGFAHIVIDKNDIPYISYTDGASGQKANVKKFDGTNWLSLGNPDFTPTECFYLTHTLDNNGNSYVAFKDGTPHHYYYQGNYNTYYPLVAMKFESVATKTNEIKKNSLFVIYPNPTGNSITVSITSTDPKDVFILRVTNTISQTVYSETLRDTTSSFTKQIDLSQLPKGIYFIELQPTSPDSPQKKAEVKKIVLQ